MDKVTIKQVLEQKDSKERDRLYGEYVKQVTPSFSWLMNMVRAFFIGGAICLLGQVLYAVYKAMGSSGENAQLWSMLTLIALSITTTGFGWYSWLARYAGAGTIVPITGFANSVASCAIEYRSEGQVYGIGCSIFKIAGPVILYGVFATWCLGVIYIVGKWLGVA